VSGAPNVPGAVDLAGRVQLGQRHRFGHLAADPARACPGGFDQPGRRAGTEGEELGLRGAARPRHALPGGVRGGGHGG
jgi:hypothetical protein